MLISQTLLFGLNVTLTSVFNFTVLLSYCAIRLFLVQKFSCSIATHGHDPRWLKRPRTLWVYDAALFVIMLISRTLPFGLNITLTSVFNFTVLLSYHAIRVFLVRKFNYPVATDGHEPVTSKDRMSLIKWADVFIDMGYCRFKLWALQNCHLKHGLCEIVIHNIDILVMINSNLTPFSYFLGPIAWPSGTLN